MPSHPHVHAAEGEQLQGKVLQVFTLLTLLSECSYLMRHEHHLGVHNTGPLLSVKYEQLQGRTIHLFMMLTSCCQNVDI